MIPVGFETPVAAAPGDGSAVAAASAPAEAGAWTVTQRGTVVSPSGLPVYGDLSSRPPSQPVTGMAATPDGLGYWLVTWDGAVYGFGDAAVYGSEGGRPLNQPIMGMASTPDGLGYWLFASDGGVFSFGDAAFYGSTGSIVLNRPVVGMASTADGRGYWLVASDGGVFSFGDAAFFGSAGSLTLARSVVGMTPTLDGHGYWLVASDGGVFTFGDAPFLGSAAGQLAASAVALVRQPAGYAVAAADGTVLFLPTAQRSPSTVAPQFVKPGPYAVDDATITLTDPSRPAPQRPGAAGSSVTTMRTVIRRPHGAYGPLPVVVFAHGYDSEPETYETLIDSLASAGYLVAAPEFPGSAADLPGDPVETDIAGQAQDVSFVVQELLAGAAGAVDPTRIAAVGHSDGGSTVAALAMDPALTTPRIDAYAVLSGEIPSDQMPGPWDASPHGSLLAEVGDADEYGNLPATTAVFDTANLPKALVVVAGGDHMDTYLAGDAVAGEVRHLVVSYLNSTLAAPETTDRELATALATPDQSLSVTVG